MNVASSQFDDDFSGFELSYVREREGSNVFTMEQIALCAIAAMKQEAIADYNGYVRDFSFIDRQHPENPVYWLMRSSPSSDSRNLRRSSVLWTLMALTIQLMRFQYFRAMPFYVSRYQVPVYDGFIQNRNPQMNSPITDNDTLTSATASPLSFTGVLLNASSMVLQPNTALKLKDEPQYTLDFTFGGFPISRYGVFESILEFLLVLGKLDALAEQSQIGIALGRLQVSIYLLQTFPYAPGYSLRQYMAVSVLESVARFYVMNRVWREMTVVLKVDGMELAKGCVTLAIRGKEWCHGLFGNDFELPPIGNEDVVVTS
ncbi:MAG: hypothetical protein LQ352_003190 [Teloschistes flavicans]|nr:MAG: hypothetical protein LQ352_003190 [Teloschistes flavicans]